VCARLWEGGEEEEVGVGVHTSRRRCRRVREWRVFSGQLGMGRRRREHRVAAWDRCSCSTRRREAGEGAEDAGAAAARAIA